MKTPLQELFEYESDLTNMFDSDVRVAGAILEYIRANKKDMLEKEKEVACKFARKYDLELGDGIMRSVEDCFDEMFNTKEK